jgi:hypothetical protein
MRVPTGPVWPWGRHVALTSCAYTAVGRGRLGVAAWYVRSSTEGNVGTYLVPTVLGRSRVTCLIHRTNQIAFCDFILRSGDVVGTAWGIMTFGTHLLKNLRVPPVTRSLRFDDMLRYLGT